MKEVKWEVQAALPVRNIQFKRGSTGVAQLPCHLRWVFAGDFCAFGFVAHKLWALVISSVLTPELQSEL